MSDYGLLLKNSDEETQIDSTYKNYSLHSTMTGTVNYNETDVNTTDTKKVPIVAYKPSTSNFCCHIGFVKSGSTFTHAKFLGGVNELSIPLRVYVEGQVNSLPTYGLIVWNSSGEVVFHSNDTPMNIVGVYSNSLAWNAGSGYIDVTVDDATNNYFILVPTYPQYIDYVLDGFFDDFYFYTRGLKKINSTTIRVGQFVYYYLHMPGGGVAPPSDTDNWIDAYTLLEIH